MIQRECVMCLPIDCCDEMFYRGDSCAGIRYLPMRRNLYDDTVGELVGSMSEAQERHAHEHQNRYKMSHVELSLPVFLPSKNRALSLIEVFGSRDRRIP